MTTLYRIDNQHALEAMVRSALSAASHEVSLRARCEVESNRVRVIGQLGSFYQKQLAQEALRQLHPDIEILNELEVLKAEA